MVNKIVLKYKDKLCIKNSKYIIIFSKGIEILSYKGSNGNMTNAVNMANP